MKNFILAFVILAIIAAGFYFLYHISKDQPEGEEGEELDFITMSGSADFEEQSNGLQIGIVKEGEGAGAVNGDVVTVHYVGALEDGTIFDSSLMSGTPFSFVLGTGKVIQGWEQGVLGMKAGERRRLIIPPELGYGDQEIPGKIPANSTLIFEIELLEIN